MVMPALKKTSGYLRKKALLQVLKQQSCYHRTQSLAHAAKADQLEEAIEQLSPTRCRHEPLLELNGKTIKGTKRCIHCGLNESYWQK